MWCGQRSVPGYSDGWVNLQRLGQEYSSFPSWLYPHGDDVLWTANTHIIYFIAQRVFERTSWSNRWIFMFCLFIFTRWKTHIFSSRPHTGAFTESLKTSLQIHWEITSSSEGCSHIKAAQYYLCISLVGFPLANWELIFYLKKNPKHNLSPSSPSNYSGFLPLSCSPCPL